MIKLGIRLMVSFLCWVPMALNAENIIFYEDDPPLSSPQDQPAAGLYFDIVTSILDDMEEDYTTSILPFKRALLNAYDDKGIVVGILKTDERSLKLDYSLSIYDSRVVLFVPYDHVFPVSSVADLKGKVIATKLGWSYGSTFDEARRRNEFEALDGDTHRNFKMLLGHRVDAFIDNHLSGLYTVKQMGITDKVKVLPHTIDVGPHYLGVKKGTHQALIARFNEHLLQFKKDGRYDLIVSGYR